MVSTVDRVRGRVGRRGPGDKQVHVEAVVEWIACGTAWEKSYCEVEIEWLVSCLTGVDLYGRVTGLGRLL